MFRKIVPVVVSLLPVTVFAAVPADVVTAMDAMKADAITVATAFLVAIIAIKAFKLMRRGA